MKPKGFFVEFVLGGRTEFSSIVESDSREMFMTVWNAAGDRLFKTLDKKSEEQQHLNHGEFRIRPIFN